MSALDRLLASEREMAERLRRAEDDARAMIEQARREAAAAEHDAEAELGRELVDLEARHEGALQESLGALAEQRAHVLAHHARLGDAQVAALGDWALRRVAGLEESASPPGARA